MNTNIYEYVISNLKKSRGSWSEVSRGSGVSKRTIEKIARKEIRDPGVSHVQKLADYFQSKERVH